jgi:hypothetical protein
MLTQLKPCVAMNFARAFEPFLLKQFAVNNEARTLSHFAIQPPLIELAQQVALEFEQQPDSYDVPC